jgi:hypothetical protein
MVAHSRCSGIRDLIGLKDHQSCSTVMVGEADSMADRCTSSQTVKCRMSDVREAEITRRCAEESFVSYFPHLEAGDSETKMLRKDLDPE